MVIATYDRAARRQAVVFATFPGERHELGLMMAALVCAAHGCKVHYLGPDLPPEEIARYAREVDADVVAVSIVQLDGVAELTGQVRRLVAALEPETVVWLGGTGAAALSRDALPAACAVIRDQVELRRRLELLED